jgi:hypothetical protein
MRSRASYQQLRESFGTPRPPRLITESPFDHSVEPLERLCQLGQETFPAPCHQPQNGDLIDYALDLQHVELQPDLFVYLFPICLEAWRHYLFLGDIYGGFVEHFHHSLAANSAWRFLLTSKQAEAVNAYMRGSILDFMDQQTGLCFKGAYICRKPPVYRAPDRWVGYLNSYATLFPDVGALWDEWWAMGTRGLAIAAIQYASCLMYPEDGNLIFAAWTRKEGGGPPCLWEYESIGFDEHWLPENVKYLQRTLTVAYLKRKLATATTTLLDQPEHKRAAHVLQDFQSHRETAKRRTAELPMILAEPSKPCIREWTV